MNIKEATTQFLKESGWTQRQLAEAIGVHKVTITRYLNHHGRKSVGEKLAEFLLNQGQSTTKQNGD